MNWKYGSESFQTIFIYTPEKRTFKNNTPAQVRILEFNSSPSRRLRSKQSNETNVVNLAIAGAIQEAQNHIHEHLSNDTEEIRRTRRTLENETIEHRQTRLEKQRQRNLLNRSEETDEHRKSRLEKQKQRNHSKRENEPSEERQTRLEKQKQRDHSKRANEHTEERQSRWEKQKQRNQSKISNETTEEPYVRLKKAKERAQYSRTSETKQQREIRLEKQRQRSQANRIKKALERSLSNRPNTQQENITVESNETQYSEPINTSKLHSFTNNENIDIFKTQSLLIGLNLSPAT